VPETLLKKAKDVVSPGDLEPFLPGQCLIIHKDRIFVRGGHDPSDKDLLAAGFIDNLYLLYTGEPMFFPHLWGGEGIALKYFEFHGEDGKLPAERWLVDMYLLQTTLDNQGFATSRFYRAYVEGELPRAQLRADFTTHPCRLKVSPRLHIKR
jgi:hypothetical protein